MTTDSKLSLIAAFLDALAQQQFSGEMSSEDSQLTVYATDNSVYMRRPQAIIWPKTLQDLQIIMRLADSKPFQNIVLTARGGGTSTNGQSLTDSVIVDMSRFMNQIIEIDAEKRRVRVQPGVVKDQLNAALKPYGLFFAPELSTSNRATIGGMINTDASGQGSCRYGKTHNHVLALKTVLLGGDVLESEALPEKGWQFRIAHKPAKQRMLYGDLYQLAKDNQALIAQSFPKLNRCLTGYDLPHLLDNGVFNVTSLLCGSEGSLGFIAEATLNVLPIVKYRALVNVGYASFQAALLDAKALMAQKPLSIETVDSKVLGLAKNDMVWQDVAPYFPKAVEGINLVELNADSEAALVSAIARFKEHLATDNTVERVSITVAEGAEKIAPLYAMRKRAVGLLGNVEGESRPIPFVEDCAVPPENLPDFIAGFRAILDDMGLSYGMFGHADAGVLHVRPQFNQKDLDFPERLEAVSDKVAALAHRYGGVLWGEHGKGLRSSYAPTFFGAAWPLIQQVKALFDPRNQLNPGKITTPATLPEAKLLGIRDVGFRGTQDRQIAAQSWQAYGNAMHCNGNGSCFNYDFDAAMCPSWKVTRDRRQSPKGRAMLIKEWLARKNSGTLTPAFEKEVYGVLHDCLSCKSCAGQCPVKVDIPDAKSRFLADYHQRHRHSLRDYTIGYLEPMLPFVARFARFYNYYQQTPVARLVNKKVLKMAGIPLFSEDMQAQLENSHAVFLHRVEDLPQAPQKPAVLIVLDAFTRYFDTPVLSDWLQLLHALGVKAYVLPYFPNGKPLHIEGFLPAFYKLRAKNEKLLAKAAQSGLAMLGLDPAMTLVYRQEYFQDVQTRPTRQILLPQEWLLQFLAAHPPIKTPDCTTYYLLPHCTEKTQLPSAGKDWQTIFAAFGLHLEVLASGCCGMAGTYGHELEHQATSAGIYAQSWQGKVAQYGEHLLATGFSCRCQVKRMDQQVLRHPLQVLLAIQKQR